MSPTTSAEAPRPGHDWHGLPPHRRSAHAARARLQAIEARRRYSRALDAHLAHTELPTTPVPAIPSQAARRELADELARAGFDPEYLAHRYDLTPATDPRTGQHRSGQRQLSAPDTWTGRHANGDLSGQNSHRSNGQEGTR